MNIVPAKLRRAAAKPAYVPRLHDLCVSPRLRKRTFQRRDNRKPGTPRKP